jgi:hypothetical protein
MSKQPPTDARLVCLTLCADPDAPPGKISTLTGPRDLTPQQWGWLVRRFALHLLAYADLHDKVWPPQT